MTRKVDLLTTDNLAELPGHCATCLFWELDPVRRHRAQGDEAAHKAAWLNGVQDDWGPVGRVLYVDDVAVGHVVWAPGRYLPGADCFATAPTSPDALLLGSTYVHPDHRGQGFGRLLVQTMAKDLVQRGGTAAVEAFGALRPRDQECVLPTAFLLGVGFKIHRDHPSYPRLRMDLRAAVTWREELGSAAGRILGAVRRPQAPVPEPMPVRVRRAGTAAPSGAR